MQDVLAIAIHLAALVAAFAIMLIGFAMMMGGFTWAGNVAWFLFARPLAAIGRGLGQLVAWAVAGFGRLLASIGRFATRTIIDPIAVVIGRVLRRLLFPRRS